MQTPLLLFSDSPSLPTGLGRITRDLATHIANHLTEYRVGTFGRAGIGSRELPFQQYDFSPAPEDQWGLRHLEKAWDDFAGSEQGIILTIQDPSRMVEFARPDLLYPSTVRTFLASGRFERWGYFPVDSTGPDDRLSGICREALKGYQRVLAYTKFGAGVLSRSLNRQIDYIPHGMDLSTFQPRERKAARISLGMPDSAIVIGCNMTNQYRKDWGLWANVCALLKRSGPNFRFWAHIDSIDRHWNLNALLEDYGLMDSTRVTLCGSTWSDEELSYFYSACDLTFLPSLGEGFGYPIAESLACGVPCIHGDYAGGAEMLPEDWRIPVQAWRLDTPYNCIRPVFDPNEFADRITDVLQMLPQDDRSLVEHLDWKQLWPACWKKWFRI